MTQQSSENTDYDNPWKTFIELYFREFLAFFFPTIEADVDWSKPVRFLDKELQKIVRDAEIPKRYADKLVEVHRLRGERTLVICHIEVQSQEERDFVARMYSYNYRLRDRYNCPVVSLAILGDDRPNWRPSRFYDELWGCATHFEFPIVKLSDYQSQWTELEAIQNPFAVVAMAHLKTKETHNQPLERKRWRYHLTTMLYDRGYSEQDILELHNFLDWLMNLPEELERQLQAELETFEEARRMKYVSSLERRAKLEEKQAIALNMLRRNLDMELIAEVTGLTIAEIQILQSQQQQD
ncbi:hypothetical protein NIES2135_18320 [Leptolyngbya boryana NIES-2135]|jgi:hypothetical protein|uniref:Transposase (putative) YhgA-like domain-containing protein n=2 Tax=Leptolyngbya boryana TaxID=1184 RepID=A0A1Z4JE51_LEPBY|nr:MULTISPECIES: hypothetical protein [Leptolyngbya]BAY55011.1 hypothetical protein NIES2135_18320 [Leptolyngbya boryana NIES-2135]MBD2365991.1 hypothetical protein [Leptolyngbya sp. FACHB-161]MBD2372171.1 hypothetical protein [Leptolyngbya sp. FACHB-238]MBD2396594.1 hypothetical protein [Leptolyngbya sp. FACHB-239]MBD2403117.1 hypothetical protein [Leptolyngbya sp. FACHB-402]